MIVVGRKRAWCGRLQWPVWGRRDGAVRHVLYVELHPREPDRLIEVGLTKDQAAIVGRQLVKWAEQT